MPQVPSRPSIVPPLSIEVPDEPLTAALDRAVAGFGTRVALDFFGATTTYAELARRIDRAAAALTGLGVARGDRVAISLPNCPSHVVAFWAVLRVGAVVVELNPTLGAQEAARLVADSDAKVVLAWSAAAGDLTATLDGVGSPQEGGATVVVPVDVTYDLPPAKRWALRLPVRAARSQRQALRGTPPAATPWHRHVAAAQPSAGAPAEASAPGDLALLIYTGGTTGEPKAVMLTHRNLVANTVQGEAWMGIDAADGEVVYGVLPFFHAFGLMLCLAFAARIAATVVLLPKFDVDAVLAAQRRRPGTFLPAVPPMLARLTAAATQRGADLSSFRIAISGSMALPIETAQAWEAATGGVVVEGYGMTETSPVALGSPLDSRRRPGVLGLPFPSTRARIVDPENPECEVGPGERGELQVAGPQIFSGYWKRPEATAEVLLPGGWLRTGDVVVRGDDGFYTLVDRSKEVIVTGGFKVYPSQVENRLRGMPQIEEVAVVGMPGGDLGERVVAAVVLARGVVSLDLATVREWVGDTLARYAVPRSVIVMAELPRSAIGKVLRRAVRENLLAQGPA